MGIIIAVVAVLDIHIYLRYEKNFLHNTYTYYVVVSFTLAERNHVGSMTASMTSGVEVPMMRSVASDSRRWRLQFSSAIAIMKPGHEK